MPERQTYLLQPSSALTMEQVTGEGKPPYAAEYVLMSRVTGKDVEEFTHLKLSIVDILTTPLGSRVMLREYGSELLALIDRAMSVGWKTRFINATISALAKWEPRILVKSVRLMGDAIREGKIILSITGYYFMLGRAVTLEGVELDFKKKNHTVSFQ